MRGVTRAQVFEALDRMDPEAWASHLAPDAVMRFANEDPVYGRDACRAEAEVLFASMASISHHTIESWAHGSATITESSVSFMLPDGSLTTVPMVTIYRTNAQGLIADYRVYVDPKPLWP